MAAIKACHASGGGEGGGEFDSSPSVRSGCRRVGGAILKKVISVRTTIAMIAKLNQWIDTCKEVFTISIRVERLNECIPKSI